MPEPPRHYARLKKLNTRPAMNTGGPALPPPLAPEEFRQRTADHSAVQLVDLRSILAFGGGHVPGALNIALRNEFVSWAGWMLDDQRQIYLIGEDSHEVHQAALQLYRIGLDHVAGYLRNGMSDWQNDGLPLECVGEWTVHELDRRRDDPQVQVLDVRAPRRSSKGACPAPATPSSPICPKDWSNWTRTGPWRPIAAAATAPRLPPASSSARVSATW